MHGVENKRELVTDIMVKAKQIEYLISSLPQPEPEEAQVGGVLSTFSYRVFSVGFCSQAARLEKLEGEMTRANEEYARAVNRASELFPYQA